ncbi:hypothetical protein PCE1_002202 [Barthelona sp. PCE]
MFDPYEVWGPPPPKYKAGSLRGLSNLQSALDLADRSKNKRRVNPKDQKNDDIVFHGSTTSWDRLEKQIEARKRKASTVSNHSKLLPKTQKTINLSFDDWMEVPEKPDISRIYDRYKKRSEFQISADTHLVSRVKEMKTEFEDMDLLFEDTTTGAKATQAKKSEYLKALDTNILVDNRQLKQSLKEMVKLDKGNVEARLGLAQLYFQEKNSKLAIRECLLGLRHKKDEDLYVVLINSLRKAENGAAIKDALQTFPSSEKLWNVAVDNCVNPISKYAMLTDSVRSHNCPHGVSLWRQLIGMTPKNELSSILSQAINFNPKVSEFWVFLARQQSTVDGALATMQRGLMVPDQTWQAVLYITSGLLQICDKYKIDETPYLESLKNFKLSVNDEQVSTVLIPLFNTMTGNPTVLTKLASCLVITDCSEIKKSITNSCVSAKPIEGDSAVLSLCLLILHADSLPKKQKITLLKIVIQYAQYFLPHFLNGAVSLMLEYKLPLIDAEVVKFLIGYNDIPTPLTILDKYINTPLSLFTFKKYCQHGLFELAEDVMNRSRYMKWPPKNPAKVSPKVAIFRLFFLKNRKPAEYDRYVRSSAFEQFCQVHWDDPKLRLVQRQMENGYFHINNIDNMMNECNSVYFSEAILRFLVNYNDDLQLKLEKRIIFERLIIKHPKWPILYFLRLDYELSLPEKHRMNLVDQYLRVFSNSDWAPDPKYNSSRGLVDRIISYDPLMLPVIKQKSRILALLRGPYKDTYHVLISAVWVFCNLSDWNRARTYIERALEHHKQFADVYAMALAFNTTTGDDVYRNHIIDLYKRFAPKYGQEYLSIAKTVDGFHATPIETLFKLSDYYMRHSSFSNLFAGEGEGSE